MGLKPKHSQTRSESNIDFDIINEQIADQLEEGLILGVVSGIVELGIQEREAMEDDNGVLQEKDPAEQLAVFIDLPEVMIDWDAAAKNKDDDDFEGIGTKPLRVMCNSEFKGDVKGITFGPGQKTDAGWTFHSNSVLTKLAKATGQKDVIDPSSEYNMDVSLLLGQPVMVNIEIKEGKNGGIFPKITSYNKPKAKDKKGVDLEVVEPFVVDWDDLDEDAVKQLRVSIKNKIARATNFEGSTIQKAFKEQGFEPRKPNNTTDKPNTSDEPPKTEGKAKASGGKKAAANNQDDDFDSDIPF